MNRFDTSTLREALQQVPPAVLERLGALFERIDAAYAQTAGQCNFKCRGCEKIALCGYCPAFFELETGREDRHSDYLCRTAAYRYDAVVNARTCEPSAFYHIPKESPYGGRKQEKRI